MHLEDYFGFIMKFVFQPKCMGCENVFVPLNNFLMETLFKNLRIYAIQHGCNW